MSQFLLAPAAKSDLIDIWNYYAAEVGDPDLADTMRDEIFDGIRAVARKPDLGHLRRDLANEPLRFWRATSLFTEVKPDQSRWCGFCTALATCKQC
jgi:plasmid stabilization system protein ParE